MLRVREFALVAVAGMAAMTGASVWQSMQPAKPHAVAAVAIQLRKPDIKVAIRIPLHMQAASKPVIGTTPDAVVKALDEDDAQNANKAIPAADLVVQEAQLDAQSGDVAARLRSRVPANLIRYFDVFLYVSKSGAGPWSQHMFVFHRADDKLVYEKNFPVSTGREQHEKYFTSTPAGIFELDPARFEPMHYSHRWHGAPMQWSMFLNYELHNHMVGIALHSAGEHVSDLGHRASGGCVRLPPEQADLLYHRFQSEERGMVPVLAFDNVSGTTSTVGETMAGPSGLPPMAEGYKVLLIIEDYPGGPALVAVLS